MQAVLCYSYVAVMLQSNSLQDFYSILNIHSLSRCSLTVSPTHPHPPNSKLWAPTRKNPSFAFGNSDNTPKEGTGKERLYVCLTWNAAKFTASPLVFSQLPIGKNT